MLPGNKTFPIVKFYLLWFWIFTSSGKNLQRYCWTCLLSIIKQLFISGFKFLQDLFFLKALIPLKWFLLHLEPVCTTTIWQMHLKFPPKFGDVMWWFHITFMQKYLLAIGDFELYTNFSNLVQWTLLHHNPFKYFFKNSSKCLEMSVEAYNSSSSKNPVLLFEKFEWISLFCILVQIGDLYCNLIFPCSSNPEFFPTSSPSYQTLKSRRLGSLEVLKCML